MYFFNTQPIFTNILIITTTGHMPNTGQPSNVASTATLQTFQASKKDAPKRVHRLRPLGCSRCIFLIKFSSEVSGFCLSLDTASNQPILNVLLQTHKDNHYGQGRQHRRSGESCPMRRKLVTNKGLQSQGQRHFTRRLQEDRGNDIFTVSRNKREQEYNCQLRGCQGQDHLAVLQERSIECHCVLVFAEHFQQWWH